MESSRAALLAILSICFIGLLFLTGIAAGQQQPSPPTTAPPQPGHPQQAPPQGRGQGPGPSVVQPPATIPPGQGQVPGRPKQSSVVRNHPGKIGGPVYVAHVRSHPHPGFVMAGNTNIQVVRNYYVTILPNGYPYYDGGYIDVDPQLDCYTWYDGDNFYSPGWYWTCDQ